jgi:hypothetical protein
MVFEADGHGEYTDGMDVDGVEIIIEMTGGRTEVNRPIATALEAACTSA